jgi:hypothetical protein
MGWKEFIKTKPTTEQIQNRIEQLRREEAGCKYISEQIDAQNEREALEVIIAYVAV